MAKRFTDTGKWDKAWFRTLTPQMKCVWMYFCDRCDHAGIWDIDWDALEFFVGGKIDVGEILETFRDHLTDDNDKRLIIRGFIEFQYGTLNPENRVHKSVLDRLEKIAPSKGLKRAFKGPKDKDKDKDLERGSAEGENLPALPEANASAAYIASYVAKYNHAPELAAKHHGILKRFKESHPKKFRELIEGYFQMPDSWLFQRSHPVEMLESKVNEITRFLATGKVVTRKVVQHAEEMIDKAQGTSRRPRKSIEQLEKERAEMMADANKNLLEGA